MKLKRIVSAVMALVVMLTSLLCCGISASASTGRYPGAKWAADTLYVDGFWNSEGYYCVRVGNFGLFEYLLAMSQVSGNFDYLNVWLSAEGYSEICLNMTMNSSGDIYVNPYILTSDQYLYNKDEIYSARYYKNSNDDMGFVMFVPEGSSLLDVLAVTSEVKLSSQIVYGGYTASDSWLTVAANFTELEANTVTDISTLTFSKITNKAYTGKAIKPAVTIKDGDKKLTSGTDYTVSYKNNTKIGTATITVTGKGNYTGKKTLTFQIAPKKTTLSIKENSAQKATLTWKKSTGATGYQIYCSTNGGSYKKLATVKSADSVSRVVSNLNTDDNYYRFMVRPYTKSGSKTIYGSWSNVVTAG